MVEDAATSATTSVSLFGQLRPGSSGSGGNSGRGKKTTAVHAKGTGGKDTKGGTAEDTGTGAKGDKESSEAPSAPSSLRVAAVHSVKWWSASQPVGTP